MVAISCFQFLLAYSARLRMRRHSVPRLLRNHSSNNDSSYSSRCCILDMVKLTMHAPARTSLLDSGVNRPT